MTVLAKFGKANAEVTWLGCDPLALNKAIF
jgi:hypothetical protein